MGFSVWDETIKKYRDGDSFEHLCSIYGPIVLGFSIPWAYFLSRIRFRPWRIVSYIIARGYVAWPGLLLALFAHLLLLAPVIPMLAWGIHTAIAIRPTVFGIAIAMVGLSAFMAAYAMGFWYYSRWRSWKAAAWLLSSATLLVYSSQAMVVIYVSGTDSEDEDAVLRPLSPSALFFSISAIAMGLNALPVTYVCLYGRDQMLDLAKFARIMYLKAHDGASQPPQHTAPPGTGEEGAPADVDLTDPSLYSRPLNPFKMYGLSVAILLAYGIIYFFAALESRMLGFRTAAVVMLMDLLLVALVWSCVLINTPLTLAVIACIVRAALISFGTRYWFLGHCIVYAVFSLVLLCYRAHIQYPARDPLAERRAALADTVMQLRYSDRAAAGRASGRRQSLAVRRLSVDAGAGEGSVRGGEGSMKGGEGSSRGGEGSVGGEGLSRFGVARPAAEGMDAVDQVTARGPLKSVSKRALTGPLGTAEVEPAAVTPSPHEHWALRWVRAAFRGALKLWAWLTGFFALEIFLVQHWPPSTVVLVTAAHPQWLFGVAAVMVPLVLALLFAYVRSFMYHMSYAWSHIRLGILTAVLVLSFGIFMSYLTGSRTIFALAIALPPLGISLSVAVPIWVNNGYRLRNVTPSPRTARVRSRGVTAHSNMFILRMSTRMQRLLMAVSLLVAVVSIAAIGGLVNLKSIRLVDNNLGKVKQHNRNTTSAVDGSGDTTNTTSMWVSSSNGTNNSSSDGTNSSSSNGTYSSSTNGAVGSTSNITGVGAASSGQRRQLKEITQAVAVPPPYAVNVTAGPAITDEPGDVVYNSKEGVHITDNAGQGVDGSAGEGGGDESRGRFSVQSPTSSQGTIQLEDPIISELPLGGSDEPTLYDIANGTVEDTQGSPGEPPAPVAPESEGDGDSIYEGNAFFGWTLSACIGIVFMLVVPLVSWFQTFRVRASAIAATVCSLVILGGWSCGVYLGVRNHRRPDPPSDTDYLVAFLPLPLIPAFVLLASGLYTWYDDKWTRSLRMKLLTGSGLVLVTATAFVAGPLASWGVALALLGVVVAVIVGVYLFSRWAENEFHIPLRHLLGLCACALVIGGGAIAYGVRANRPFAGASAAYFLLLIVTFIHAMRKLRQQPVILSSPVVLPVFGYSPETGQPVDVSLAQIEMYFALVGGLLWGVMASLVVFPPYAGVAMTSLIVVTLFVVTLTRSQAAAKRSYQALLMCDDELLTRVLEQAASQLMGHGGVLPPENADMLPTISPRLSNNEDDFGSAASAASLHLASPTAASTAGGGGVGGGNKRSTVRIRNASADKPGGGMGGITSQASGAIGLVSGTAGGVNSTLHRATKADQDRRGSGGGGARPRSHQHGVTTPESIASEATRGLGTGRRWRRQRRQQRKVTDVHFLRGLVPELKKSVEDAEASISVRQLCYGCFSLGLPPHTWGNRRGGATGARAGQGARPGGRSHSPAQQRGALEPYGGSSLDASGQMSAVADGDTWGSGGGASSAMQQWLSGNVTPEPVARRAGLDSRRSTLSEDPSVSSSSWDVPVANSCSARWLRLWPCCGGERLRASAAAPGPGAGAAGQAGVAQVAVVVPPGSVMVTPVWRSAEARRHVLKRIMMSHLRVLALEEAYDNEYAEEWRFGAHIVLLLLLATRAQKQQDEVRLRRFLDEIGFGDVSAADIARWTPQEKAAFAEVKEKYFRDLEKKKEELRARRDEEQKGRQRREDLMANHWDFMAREEGAGTFLDNVAAADHPERAPGEDAAAQLPATTGAITVVVEGEADDRGQVAARGAEGTPAASSPAGPRSPEHPQLVMHPNVITDLGRMDSWAPTTSQHSLETAVADILASGATATEGQPTPSEAPGPSSAAPTALPSEEPLPLTPEIEPLQAKPDAPHLQSLSLAGSFRGGGPSPPIAHAPSSVLGSTAGVSPPSAMLSVEDMMGKFMSQRVAMLPVPGATCIVDEAAFEHTASTPPPHPIPANLGLINRITICYCIRVAAVESAVAANSNHQVAKPVRQEASLALSPGNGVANAKGGADAADYGNDLALLNDIAVLTIARSHNTVPSVSLAVPALELCTIDLSIHLAAPRVLRMGNVPMQDGTWHVVTVLIDKPKACVELWVDGASEGARSLKVRSRSVADFIIADAESQVFLLQRMAKRARESSFRQMPPLSSTPGKGPTPAPLAAMGRSTSMYTTSLAFAHGGTANGGTANNDDEGGSPPGPGPGDGATEGGEAGAGGTTGEDPDAPHPLVAKWKVHLRDVYLWPRILDAHEVADLHTFLLNDLGVGVKTYPSGGLLSVESTPVTTPKSSGGGLRNSLHALLSHSSSGRLSNSPHAAPAGGGSGGESFLVPPSRASMTNRGEARSRLGNRQGRPSMSSLESHTLAPTASDVAQQLKDLSNSHQVQQSFDERKSGGGSGGGSSTRIAEIAAAAAANSGAAYDSLEGRRRASGGSAESSQVLRLHLVHKNAQSQADIPLKPNRTGRDRWKTKQAAVISVLNTLGYGTFTDPTFPPRPSSIFVNPSRPRRKLAHATQWLKPRQIVEQPKEAHQLTGAAAAAADAALAAAGPIRHLERGSMDNIVQGRLGDCWFLSAVAVYATKYDIRNIIITDRFNEEGVYTVRFHRQGQWVQVVVDDWIPCDKNGRPAFSHSKNDGEFWIGILEKAYAKLHGSYEALEGGLVQDALVDLTGGAGEEIDLTHPDVKLDLASGKLWKRVLRFYANGYLLAAGSPSGADSEVSEAGIVQGHAYAILQVVEVDGHQLLQLRNPWANEVSWTGPWSADSPQWTDRMMHKLRFDRNGPAGVFWMSWEDFQLHFASVYVCRIYPNNERHVIRDRWQGLTAGGCANYDTFQNNPQYLLKAKDPTVPLNVFMTLAQGVQGPVPTSRTGSLLYIGIRVAKKNGQRIRGVLYSRENMGGSSYVNMREVSCELLLPPYPPGYTIIVSTFQPGSESQFLLTVYTKAAISLEPLPDAPASST